MLLIAVEISSMSPKKTSLASFCSYSGFFHRKWSPDSAYSGLKLCSSLIGDYNEEAEGL